MRDRLKLRQGQIVFSFSCQSLMMLLGFPLPVSEREPSGICTRRRRNDNSYAEHLRSSIGFVPCMHGLCYSRTLGTKLSLPDISNSPVLTALASRSNSRFHLLTRQVTRVPPRYRFASPLAFKQLVPPVPPRVIRIPNLDPGRVSSSNNLTGLSKRATAIYKDSAYRRSPTPQSQPKRR